MKVTVREKLASFERSKHVRIYSERYDIYVASGTVLELEQDLTPRLMEIGVVCFTEVIDTGVVTLVID